MKGLCRIALAVLFLAACGGESAVTGLDDPMVPNGASSGGSILAIGVDSVTGASIETNKDDYSPGEVVHLVGRGWAAGETVNLHMTEAPNTHADVDTNVVADASGGFSLHFYDVQTHDLGVTFTLTATGSASHSRATAVFTDGNFALRASFTPTGGPSFTGTILKFAQSTICDPSSSGQSTVNAPAVTTSAGPQAGVNEDNSALITVPATVGSYSFTGWSISGAVTFVTGSTSTSSICVVGTPSGSSGARTFTANYVITNTAPTASAGGPYTGTEGTAIALSSATASDGDSDPLTYKWTVNTTGIDVGGVCTFSPSDVVLNPSVTCTDDSNPPGKFTLTLEVKDGAGGHTVTRTADLTVNNAMPTANAGGPYGGNVNANIALNGSGDDPGNNDDAGLTYAWTVNTFGNGTCSFTPTNTTKNATISCTNPSAAAPDGVFKLSLTASDDDGGTSAASAADLTITNQAPTSVPGGPYSGNEGSPISINGSGVDPDGGTVTFEWSVSTVECSFANANAAATTVTCTDNGAFTLTLKATDDEGAFTTNTTALNVANVAPTVTGVTALSSVNEGPGTFAFSATGVTDPSAPDVAFGFQYAFSCDNGGTWTGYSTTNSGTCSAPDGPANITVAVKAKDKDGGESSPVTKSVAVNNLKPTVTGVTTPSPVNEGPSFNFSATAVTDPSPVDQGSPFHYAFSCDNGGTWSAFSTTNSGTCAAPDGPATVTVAVKARDKDGAESDPVSAVVTIQNVAPTVTGVTAPTTVLEGSSILFSASGVTDPSTADAAAGFDYSYSCDDGGTWTSFGSATSHTCAANDGPSTITVAVRARDKDLGISTKKSAAVTVNNVAPTLSSVTGSVTPVALGVSTSITLSFSDPANTFDTYTASVNWDDGNGYITGGTVTPGGSVSKTFSQAGVYTVCAKVSDEDGGISDEKCYAYIVVYDPNGGFVTGGGWINSLAGYYRLNSAAEGKANFGFVSKYQPGRTVPTGNTEFQFHAGNMNFKSTTYEWLVVAGTKAMYKGEGTIAGMTGVYGFLLSAIDGSPDKFRIKIWEKTSGDLVYDTLPDGAADDADPATTLGGGSIVVHNKK